MSDVREQALDWLAHDPDPDTCRGLRQMLEDSDSTALERAFGPRLVFGTAGLRGPIGPGPAAMNRLLVQRVSRGLARYVRGQAGAGRRAVIGFDGRHKSRAFAHDTASVLADAGMEVWLFDQVCPTPLCAYAVRHLSAAVGVMVTASHNPPEDNGYKVYWSTGGQIIEPHDSGITEAIDAVWDEHTVPTELATLRAAGRVRAIPVDLVDAYHEAVQGLRVHHSTGARVVYTAMHGVGAVDVLRALRTAGHTDVHPVPAQRDPDPDFPTVRFPNPEEPGAMDLSMTLARDLDADVVIANDPDADRLAVAVPDGDGFRQLTGNQVGLLLAHDLLSHGDGAPPLVATTIVSSKLLADIARHHGAAYGETLTGFKWLGELGRKHEERGGRFVLGFEEALGYSIGGLVRDKDGVSAALVMADLVSWLRSQDRTLLDALAELGRLYGVSASTQKSFRMPGEEGKARIEALLASLREQGVESVDGVAVVRSRDLLSGEARDHTTGSTSIIDLPRSNVLAWDLADGSRILARPSGTEPKVKFYFEVVEPMGDEALATAEARANQRLEKLRAAFLERLTA